MSQSNPNSSTAHSAHANTASGSDACAGSPAAAQTSAAGSAGAVASSSASGVSAAASAAGNRKPEHCDGIGAASTDAAAVSAEGVEAGQGEEADAKERLLPRVVFLGRSLGDYREMFDLEGFPQGFEGKKILDVGAGSATFAAESAGNGIAVTAVDPLYGLSVEALDKRSIQDQETSFAALVKHSKHYVADDTQLSQLRARREATRRQFIEDYRVGLALGRYLQAELPHLPFEDDAFDIALCGNFLFLYGHLFGLDFHLRAIDELLRVARNVRIYPLVGLDSVPPPFAEELIARLQAREDIVAKRIEIKSSILSNRVEGLILTRKD